MYHVPQHSRREKLRFHPQEDYPPPPSLLLLHDPSIATPLFSPNAPAAFLPASCSSSHCSQNPTYSLSPTAQFMGSSYCSLATQQDPHHGFYLSLSSSSPPAPPPPPPPPPPPARCHPPGIGYVFDHGAPRSPAPLGPFTGYAAVLNRSRFLEPARQLLEEICDVGRPSLVKASRAGRGDGGSGGDRILLDGEPPELSPPFDHEIRSGPAAVSGAEQQWKKTRLLSMLDEVYKRYKYYYQQVQAVITSFESVAGLTTAAPYGTMALKAMLKHFRCLKNMIWHQLHHTNKVLGKEGHSGGEIASFGLMNGGVCLQRTANSSGSFGQPHVWRPQRGLPERAVAVLRAWLFEHFLHPYPTDTDKQVLAKQTGLTRNQVSNWFINARVRLWKPMVEEIHNLEMRQLHKTSASDKNHHNNDQAQLPSASTATPSSSLAANNVCTQKNEHASATSMQNDLTQIPNHIQEPFNFGYDGLSSDQQMGMGSSAANIGNGGVSLTLGLHQNNGVCIGEQLPFNVARRFGLEECSDAYVISTFEAQDRQFGKDIGGHLLHDFVG